MAYRVLDLQPDPALLNPRFDGYKLRLVDSGSDGAVRTHQLQSASAQPQLLASNELFTYDEVCSRIHYNHLFVGPRHGTFVYFTKNRCAFLVDTSGACSPQFTLLFEIPPRTSTSASQGYPGAYSLSDTHILIFDGTESLYVLQHIECDGEHWQATGVFEIGTGSVAAGPPGRGQRPNMNYVLGATLGHVKGAGLVIRMHICYRIDKEAAATQTRTGHSMPTFCIQALQVDMPTASPGTREVLGAGTLCPEIPALSTSTAHTLHTHAIPVYCAYVGWDQYMLGVRGGVVLDDTELVLQPTDSSESTASAVLAAAAANTDVHHYHWTQSASDVTVCMELPQPLKSSQIQCELTRNTVSLHLAGGDPSLAKYACERVELYDRIVADDSVWTLENGRLLTLYLQKEHEGARWASVFSADDGVLEAMDPSELVAIRERLEKYTAADQEAGRSTAPLMQQYVDQDSGGDLEQLEEQPDASVMFSARDWRTGQAEATSVPGSPGWLCAAFSRAPAQLQGLQPGVPPVCLKFDVDGVVFSFDMSPSSSSGGSSSQQQQHVRVDARHAGTFSALSYVQASKREKRLVSIDPDMAVAVLAEAQRRIYIYHQVPRADAASAAQNVVDLGGSGDDAEILGMQAAGRVLVVLRARSLCTIDLDSC